ncbi:MAG: hypothetical protein SH859_09375, partial [Hyphomicrobium aestuarii]|nr:hypothetical protein [Hyphomicrobium aestuarii]
PAPCARSSMAPAAAAASAQFTQRWPELKGEAWEKDAARARQYFEQAARRGHLVSQLDASKLKYFCPMINPVALAEIIPVAIRIAQERRSNASSLAIYT